MAKAKAAGATTAKAKVAKTSTVAKVEESKADTVATVEADPKDKVLETDLEDLVEAGDPQTSKLLDDEDVIPSYQPKETMDGGEKPKAESVPAPKPQPKVPVKAQPKPQHSAQGNKKVNPNVPPVAGQFPEHTVNIALLIKNNAEIRRFTALGIINYLLQKGEIRGNSRYVSFKWNKFAVKYNGLTREYLYTEPFFLNCLVAAFSSFSASAQRTIDTFTRKEMDLDINSAVDVDQIGDIHNMNEVHTLGE